MKVNKAACLLFGIVIPVGLQAQDAQKGFTPQALETIKEGIRNRESRDGSRLTTMRIEIDAGAALVYRARKLGPEEHHVILSDEPLTRGGTDTAPSPLGIFAASLGMCVMNQFNRLAITADLDLTYTRGSLRTVFSGEEGAEFKEFTQEVFAEGDVTEAEIEKLTGRVEDFCRIHTTLRRVVPMTTILHVNGVEVSRREFLPEDYR